MGEPHRKVWVTSLTLSAVLLLAVSGLRCAGRTQGTRGTNSPAGQGRERDDTAQRPPTPTSASVQGLRLEVAADSAPEAPAPTDASVPARASDNPVAHLMATTDAHDRALLSELERTLKRDPPAEVY